MTLSYKEYKAMLEGEKATGEAPEWMHTTGYQILRKKGYIDDDETPMMRFRTIAAHLATYLPEKVQDKYESIFLKLLSSGKFSLATPAFCNIAKPHKGTPIACSGGLVPNSVDGFYTSNREVALLSKNGFGTSVYLGDIQARGTPVDSGGTAGGVVPVMDMFFDTASKVSQGGQRRGAVACYLPIDHPDAREVFHYVEANQKGTNIGLNITNAFIQLVKDREAYAVELFQELCYARCIGKGYLHFVDRANVQMPQVFKDLGMEIKGSNLCAEIELPSDEEYTFTCCISSLNLRHLDDITDQDIKASLLLLDCINQDFLEVCPDYLGKAKKFSKDFNALGLGVMGLATYLQGRGIRYDSLEAGYVNLSFFRRLRKVADEANRERFRMLGASDIMTPYKLRSATQLAVAPTLSTAVVMGGVSQGIEPIFANTFIHESPAGDIRRASPWLVALLKERGIWNKEILDSIVDREGSIAHLTQLSDKERALGLTAYELDQYALVRMAEARAKYIDQGQSFNMYFNGLATEEEIGNLHRYVMFNCKDLKSAYYIRSMSLANSVIKHEVACESCAS